MQPCGTPEIIRGPAANYAGPPQTIKPEYVASWHADIIPQGTDEYVMNIRTYHKENLIYRQTLKHR